VRGGPIDLNAREMAKVVVPLIVSAAAIVAGVFLPVAVGRN
jgi:hypothetical protein